jgi:probable F420-dependent oxidoreductase
MTNDLRDAIGPFGFWLGRQFLPEGGPELRDVAAQLDTLGVSALWLGGSPPGNLNLPEELLAGSERLVVGTSILNIWTEDAAEVAASCDRIAQLYGDRFVLGLGAGHAPTAEGLGMEYVKPLSKLRGFLDELDSAPVPVPVKHRMLAALGPKALETAAERSAGALPYLTTPEHTQESRAIMGPDAILVAEHKVVLTTDRQQAHAIGRKTLRTYLRLPNYVNNWRRLGFGDDDFTDGGSDRLIDTLIVYGTMDSIMARLREHLEAGADQVAVQSLTLDSTFPAKEWQQLAEAFADSSPR